MTQKDKELLMKDLSAKLLYGVMLNIDYYDLQGDGKLKNRDVILSYGNVGYCSDNTNWVSVKPYLRPMSSMTEEEKSELWFLLTEGRTNIELNSNGQLTTRDDIELGFNYPCVCPQISSQYVDWLNEHYFDYRGLIKKGLALEAPKEMYKTQ